GAATGTFTTSPTAATVNNLIVNRGAGVTLSQNITATGNLDFQNGLLTPSTFNMTIGTAGNVINYTSGKYVNGKLFRAYNATGSKIFPIGKSGAYRPMSLDITALTGTSTVAAEDFESALTGTLPAGVNLNNTHYWDVSQSGGTGIAYKVTLDPTGDTVTGTVVMLKKESGTITSNASTTPNYTNASAYSGMTATVSHTLGSGCTQTISAGADQVSSATCGLTTVTLSAVSPTYGTGAWSIVSGTGGSFSNTASPTSNFTGTAGVTYTLKWEVTNGNCINNDLVDVKFNQNPTAASNTSTQTICSNASALLTANTPGVGTGAWSVLSGPSTDPLQFSSLSSASATFTPNGGAGSYIIRWTISNSPCSASTADAIISVTSAPNAGTLSGTQSICSNGSTTFTSNGDLGGTFSSNNTAVATVDPSTGVITPVAAGTATITYTVTGTGPCANATATRTVTVTTAPNAGALSGTQAICSNGSTTFTSNGNAGGTFTSDNTSVATIDPSTGVITPVAAGTATITYTVTGTGPCANATATRTVTVTAAPNGGALSGTQAICSNGSTTFTTNGDAGGTFSSSDTGVATVDPSTGVITAVASGTATITYTVTGTAPCGNATATRTVTVNPAPTASITGNNGPVICSGSTASFTISGTTDAVVTYNINNGSPATVTLTGGTATVTVSAASLRPAQDDSSEIGGTATCHGERSLPFARHRTTLLTVMV
ncbi:MAG: hypothetical protein EOP49_21355, partial [Sphingobacteriales bacterium]